MDLCQYICQPLWIHAKPAILISAAKLIQLWQHFAHSIFELHRLQASLFKVQTLWCAAEVHSEGGEREWNMQSCRLHSAAIQLHKSLSACERAQRVSDYICWTGPTLEQICTSSNGIHTVGHIFNCICKALLEPVQLWNHMTHKLQIFFLCRWCWCWRWWW